MVVAITYSHALGLAPASPPRDPQSVVDLDGGGFAVIESGSTATTLAVAIYDSDANLLHVTDPFEGVDAAITTLPNGYILTTYSTAAFAAEIHGTVVDPDTGTVLYSERIDSGPDVPGYLEYYGAYDSAVWRDGDGTVSVSYKYDVAWVVQIPGGDYESYFETGHPTLQYDLIRTTAGQNAADTIAGDALIDVALGGAGNDVIDGRGGNDTLDGGVGADTLIGATGNDVYVIDADDTVIENADEGIDTVRFPASYSLGSNLENLVLLGGDFAIGSGNALDNTLVGNDGSNILFGYGGNDTLDGRAGAHAMAGGTGNDLYLVDDYNDLALEAQAEGSDTVQSSTSFTLGPNVEILILAGHWNHIAGSGNELNNIVTGNNGANVLAGLGGADTLTGGGGSDAADYSTSPSGVTVSLQSGLGSGGDATGDSLAGIEDLTGSRYDDVLTGDAGNNRLDGNTGSDLLYGAAGLDALYGGLGNDSMDGGAGYDSMYGGVGDDFLYFDDAHDSAYENAGEGIDRIYAAATATLPANVEQLYADAGATGLRLVGNELANDIRGGDGNDSLYGGLGNDACFGSIGYNEIYGDAGDDLLVGSGLLDGGDGNDTAFGGNLSDRLFGGNGLDWMYGSAGADILDGGANVDRMYGGTGHDSYYVDSGTDRAYESYGEGSDRIYTAIGLVLPANVEQLYAIGIEGLRLGGNELANSIFGSDGSDSLYGGLGNDTLSGGLGNDWFDGGAGADRMGGGSGDDTFIVNNAGDVVVEYANQGIDLVRSSVGYTLPNNVEHLTLTGTGNTGGTGNGLANTISGTTGSNLLEGKAGADLLRGGAGNDTYIVDNAGDVVVEYVNQGIDLVRSRVGYTLANNVEHLTLTGAGNIAGTGNGLANTIIGTTGNNALDGKAGADLLRGGMGNDTYIVDNAGDVVVEYVNQGIDLVRSSVGYTLANNVEHLTLTGAGNIGGTGNGLANMITGSSGHNVLNGLAGNDTIVGGAGNDIVAGGTGADIFRYAAGGGDDHILDFSGGAGDRVDLTGVSVAVLDDNLATLSDGHVILAQAGYAWTGVDFV